MPDNFRKVVGVAAAIACFYVLQYVGVAIHFGCQDPKEDCPPPLYGAGELLYWLIQPPWLTLDRSL